METLDPQLVNLTKAFRQVESQSNFQAKGKSGEYGAYQFTKPTWDTASKKFGVNVPLEQATPEQQTEVAYKQLESWKKMHPDWNIGNYASAWNAGSGKPDAYKENNVGTNKYGVSYDTPTYAKNVATAYQDIKNQSQPNQSVQPNTPQVAQVTDTTQANVTPMYKTPVSKGLISVPQGQTGV